MNSCVTRQWLAHHPLVPAVAGVSHVQGREAGQWYCACMGEATHGESRAAPKRVEVVLCLSCTTLCLLPPLVVRALQAGRLLCRLMLHPVQIEGLLFAGAVLRRLSFAMAAAQITAPAEQEGHGGPLLPCAAAGALTILAMDLRGHGQSRTADDSDLSAEVSSCFCFFIPCACVRFVMPLYPVLYLATALSFPGPLH